jgi:peptidoglycan hydrolase CwlO-like protein
VRDLRSDVESLKTSTSNLANQLQQQIGRVDTLSRDLEKVSGNIKALSGDLSTASTVAYVALVLALVSLILSILRWVRR